MKGVSVGLMSGKGGHVSNHQHMLICIQSDKTPVLPNDEYIIILYHRSSFKGQRGQYL